MDKDWVNIFSSTDVQYIHMLKALLEDNGLPAIILNQQDSLYNFGEAKLYVHKTNVIRAKHLIKEQ